MATSPDTVRTELTLVTAAALTELRDTVEANPPGQWRAVLLTAIPALVPEFYDAAGALAVDWYEDIRDEVGTSVDYAARIIGDPVPDWIEREVEAFAVNIEAEFEAEMGRMLAEAEALVQKEVARGFRDTVTGNVRSDRAAIGWSRHTRTGACKFCQMLAGKSTLYRSEETGLFAAHKNCHCLARPEFEGGEHGPEASVIQYVASQKRAKTEREQDARNAKLRAYLNEHYPDARG